MGKIITDNISTNKIRTMDKLTEVVSSTRQTICYCSYLVNNWSNITNNRGIFLIIKNKKLAG